jgi:hypothetical protein
VSDNQVTVVGWKEWAALPDLGVKRIKVKIDTGARTSALHVDDMKIFFKDGHRKVSFRIRPYRRRTDLSVLHECNVIEERSVKNSGGKVEKRPVIQTRIRLAGKEFPIEVTLTNREDMIFRMLLGRQALIGRFVVDPGRSESKNSS